MILKAKYPTPDLTIYGGIGSTLVDFCLFYLFNSRFQIKGTRFGH